MPDNATDNNPRIIIVDEPAMIANPPLAIIALRNSGNELGVDPSRHVMRLMRHLREAMAHLLCFAGNCLFDCRQEIGNHGL